MESGTGHSNMGHSDTGHPDLGLVRVTRDGAVATVELSRPAAMNALSTAMALELTAAMTGIAQDPGIHAVVLAGAGDRAFCVGADLKERNAMSDDEFRDQREVFRTAFASVRDLPQPAVAAVHGFALGCGCELALSCDLLVADETAVLGLPEVTVGLVPGGGGTQLTLRRLGPGRAADLVLTGRRVPAGEAHDMGLVDRLGAAGRAEVAAPGRAGPSRGEPPGAARG